MVSFRVTAALVLCLVALVALVATGCSRPAPPPAAQPPSPRPVDLSSEPTDAATEAAARPSPRPARRPPPRGVLHYVALGDSLASGMGGKPSYADFYRDALARRTGRRVVLTNLGRPGWTSGQLLSAIRNDERYRDAIARANVITWDIGGNDIIGAVLRGVTRTCGGDDGLACVRDTTIGFVQRWDAIVDELTTLPRDDDVALLTFDLYTPFIPPAARSDHVLDQLAAMNAKIRASDGRGVEVAPVAEAFAGDSAVALISDDGLHPSRAGHRLIARLLLRLGVPHAQ